MGSNDSKYNYEGDEVSESDDLESLKSFKSNNNDNPAYNQYSQGFEDGVKYALEILEKDIKNFKF